MIIWMGCDSHVDPICGLLGRQKSTNRHGSHVDPCLACRRQSSGYARRGAAMWVLVLVIPAELGFSTKEWRFSSENPGIVKFLVYF